MYHLKETQLNIVINLFKRNCWQSENPFCASKNS